MRRVILVIGLVALAAIAASVASASPTRVAGDPICHSFNALVDLKLATDSIDQAILAYRPDVFTRAAALRSLPVAVERYASWAASYRTLRRRADLGYLTSSMLQGAKPSLPSAWNGQAQGLANREYGMRFFSRLFAQFLSGLKTGSADKMRRANASLNSQGQGYKDSLDRLNVSNTARLKKAARDIHQTVRPDGNIVVNC